MQNVSGSSSGLIQYLLLDYQFLLWLPLTLHWMSFLIMLISFPHSLLAYEDMLGLDKKVSRLIKIHKTTLARRLCWVDLQYAHVKVSSER